MPTHVYCMHCAVPENIHTKPMEGHWKCQEGGLGEGISKANKIKVKYEAYLEFGRVGFKPKNLLLRGYRHNFS